MVSYVALGVRHELTLQPLQSLANEGQLAMTAGPAGARMMAHPKAKSEAAGILESIRRSKILSSRLNDPSNLTVVQGAVEARPNMGSRHAAAAPISTRSVLTLVTETVIAEGLRQADLAAAKNYGATVLEEALDGKMLLQVDTVQRVFGLVDLLLKREVGSATPNFLRRVVSLNPSPPAQAWSHAKIGVAAAWAITKGSADVRVAVLDEGVDTSHPSLKAAVVAQRDFIGNNGNSAMPSGDDAHGTACSGIVLSRDKKFPGIAPGCSLIAARIAMGDGNDGWIIEDFSTADAIDWCWRQGAAVLSNSWGGGAPSDAISRAFARARTQGRGGLGSVVCIAAGNDQMQIDFPGDLPGYVTVGASNPKDERKTKTSSDGENWWGSNFGPTMHLLAPGVFIWTTDISGPAGYEPGHFTKTFNGTSSATPAVAGVAALMLSANPALSATSVRNLLSGTAKKIQKQKGWTPQLGWGRLDAAKAVQSAKVAGAPAQPTAARKAAKKSAKSKPKAKAKPKAMTARKVSRSK